MDTRRRRSLTALLTLPAGLALAATSVLPAHAAEPAGDPVPAADPASEPAAGPAYVALGDSFSAGTGTRASTDDDCYRSPYGYPALIADAQGFTLDYQACSGGTTSDVLANQVGALSPETALVTMTIGGNDVKFADVVTECALPGWLSDCEGAIAEGRAILQNELPGRYDNVLAAIDTGAPNADVRISGYPHLFNGQDCHVATFFSAEEMAELNAATDELDALVEQKTTGAGFTYLDPRAAFDGHAVCDDVEWINGLSWPVVESFHPNRDGNIAYADIFWAGSGSAVAETVPAEPVTASVAQSVRQEADAILAMNLTSPEHLRAAAEEGVDTDRLTALVEQLRSDDTDVVTAALQELSDLNDEHADRYSTLGG